MPSGAGSWQKDLAMSAAGAVVVAAVMIARTEGVSGAYNKMVGRSDDVVDPPGGCSTNSDGKGDDSPAS